ncbi:hypothetical protein [Exiguobacterium sp. s157]|uniref:hypothetical protein n=1 Tax=Exiguobacterium sp. s157 TaxID=2751233 RepID=UPI001BE8F46B|nr:hypothetical protein [Exiguobacterium sp. s157]
MKIKDINKIELLYKRTLAFLIAITVVQQMPIINESFYFEIRVVLYIVFALLCIIPLLNLSKSFKYKTVRIFLFVILYNVILFLVFGSFGFSVNIMELLIPFGILICSLNTNFTQIELSKIIRMYVILAAILGFSSVLYYSGGFEISEIYSIPSKNQIGPIIGISIIIVGVWIFDKKKFNLYSPLFLKITMLLMLISSLLVIRNRASIVAILIVFFMYFIFDLKIKKTYKNLFIIQILSISILVMYFLGHLDYFIDVIWKSLTLNYDVTDLNSLSAQRTDVYFYALDFALQNPILGKLAGIEFGYYTPHNFILFKWVSYGIIGSIPFVILYLYLWYFVVDGILKIKRIKTNSLAIWILLFSLIVSIFEFTYPFGPGVSQIMLWFLIGQYIRRES